MRRLHNNRVIFAVKIAGVRIVSKFVIRIGVIHRLLDAVAEVIVVQANATSSLIGKVAHDLLRPLAQSVFPLNGLPHSGARSRLSNSCRCLKH